MARPKLIEDSVLLELIKKYFNEECNNDEKKLKAAEVTRYINKNGYPDYPVTTLRRTPVAMDYIKELKKRIADDGYVTVASYQTVDAVALVESNRSKDKLIKAIIERDCYYKKVADSAVYFLNNYDTLNKQCEEEKRNNILLSVRVSELEELVKKCNSEIKQLEKDLKAYKSVVKNYVYPEIANELLVKEGALRLTETPLKENVLDSNLITPTTDIRKRVRSGSNVINRLYDNLEE